MKDLIRKPWFIGVMLTAIALTIWYLYSRRWKRFSDNGQAGTLADMYNGTEGALLGGSVAFIATEPHGLQAGDEVEIQQDSGAKYPGYNGKHLVSAIITDKVFAVAHDFEGNSPVNPGRFRKA